LTFFFDLAIGVYKIVILQRIKEVIANRHEKLNKLVIDSSNSVSITCQKILKLVDLRCSYSVLHQCCFFETQCSFSYSCHCSCCFLSSL